MIIGEAPGYWETVHNKPFIGPSGQLLQKVLVEKGLTLKELYVTNAVKHRPFRNQTPLSTDRYTCVHSFLGKEIDIVEPKLILTLGRTAKAALYDLKSMQEPRYIRESGWYYNSTPVISAWHPSYVLRNPSKIQQFQADVQLAIKTARYNENYSH